MKRGKPRQISRKQASDNRILAKIKQEMTPVCVICGKWCVPDLMHLLPRSIYPQHKTNPLNLAIGCRICHNKYDNDIIFRRKQKRLYEQIKSFDEIGAYRYFKICEIE